MNRNRDNVPRDETTRIIHHHLRADTHSWLRTLHDIRALREMARPR